MDKYKLAEVVKKSDLTLKEAIEKLKESGVDINDESDEIDINSVKTLGVDPKLLSVDKRQQMLKKALERHKRHPRPKEVVVKENGEPQKKTKISKEELLKKKKELEKNLKKVDEERSQVQKTQKTKVEKTEPKKAADKKSAEESSKKAATEKVAKTDEDKKKVSPASKSAGERGKQQEQSAKIKKEEITKEVQTPDAGLAPDFYSEENIAKRKKKEEDDLFAEKEKEGKKAKGKKGVKKDKNIQRDIWEGIEELELEEEIEEELESEETEAPQTAEQEPVKEEVQAEEKEKEEKKVKKEEAKPKDKKKGKPQPQKKGKEKKAEQPKPQKPVKPEKIQIGESVTVSEFAGMIGIKATELIKKLMMMGVMATVNQHIDAETAQLLGAEYDIEVETKTVKEDDLLPQVEDDPEKMQHRPPIVTVMGHVDHGKTSLLDAIRETKVADAEAGGITQHIGAYEVDHEKGKVVFLDTPGHEAFSGLRARGANVTDIVILIVAADDGVMPQTKEAIDHAKAAGVRMVVAINKVDKPNANVEKVKTQLAEYNIIPEEWGGEYQFEEISAKNHVGIDDLLDRVLLESEMLELKADPDRPAEGIVIESQLDKQKGPVGTVLVKKGTLRVGDAFVVGDNQGKVRAMFNYAGKPIKKAGPSIPVEVMGFSEVPESGDSFIVTKDEKTAKQVASMRHDKKKEKELAERSKVSLNDLFDRIKEGEISELNIVIKADVQGSLEALKNSLLKLSNPEVKLNIIHGGVGGINESDILLASASNAIVIGFNVRPDSKAKTTAEKEDVEINLYSVIYEAIESVEKAIEGMLTPETKENVIGRVEVRQVFSVPKAGKIAGSYVLEGKVVRNAHARVVRDNVVVYDGAIDSLKRFQNDAKEVTSGYECGIGIAKFNDIKEGDILEIYEFKEEKRTIEDVQKEHQKEKADNE
ncbi:translation initiation factor IF-2 [Flexistipes sinusarabici DSM 4947]|uniref:Translation initiation factor IF-2 n=1 Tax=Flexistipes sinusarabici (strain ATCC 49648 / DSM 4947 / MAS 10) TaxID=717231 RepID=F8E8D3_FLESM|nr:translation initiation factor IF-2 [Flexistipes sinusarabici]AEI15130.1 translation initiation factor IF-2 [Flexistipes sinusarabici DSM 4947]